jgi:hypothetical protein
MSHNATFNCGPKTMLSPARTVRSPYSAVPVPRPQQPAAPRNTDLTLVHRLATLPYPHIRGGARASSFVVTLLAFCECAAALLSFRNTYLVTNPIKPGPYSCRLSLSPSYVASFVSVHPSKRWHHTVPDPYFLPWTRRLSREHDTSCTACCRGNYGHPTRRQWHPSGQSTPTLFPTTTLDTS